MVNSIEQKFETVERLDMAYTLSVAEAAKRLGVTVQAVYKRIHQGTLDAIQLNRQWLLNDEEGSIMVPTLPGRPRKGVGYTLMNGPYPVMDFNYREESGTFKTYEVFDSRRAPLGVVTRAGNGNSSVLKEWWDHRSIPESREGLDAKLVELGLSCPEEIPFRNLGLSLSDQYWICPKGVDIDWHAINYFENDFGDALAWRTGSSSALTRNSSWDDWLSQVGLQSPDNTSEGALPKQWVCRGSERLLLKGSNPWCDQQPFNEAVATALHKRLLGSDEFGSYELVKSEEGDVIACSCPCFLQLDEEYIPISQVLSTQGRRAHEGDYEAIVRLCGNLGIKKQDVELYLSKMIVCDAILANNDRHTRNFGIVRDIDSLHCRMAPLFDSGNSLWFDKDEYAVARKNWSFVLRPFDMTPNRQLYLAGRMEWLDPASLDGFAEEAVSILEESVFALPRLDYIKEGIESRIVAVLDMRGWR